MAQRGAWQRPGTLRRSREAIPDPAEPQAEEASLWQGLSPTRGASLLLIASSGDRINAGRTKPRSGGEEGRGCSTSEGFFHRQAPGEGTSGLLRLGTSSSDQRGWENKARGAPVCPCRECRDAGPHSSGGVRRDGVQHPPRLTFRSILPAQPPIKPPKQPLTSSQLLQAGTQRAPGCSQSWVSPGYRHG